MVFMDWATSRVTMGNTMRSNNVSLSKTIKLPLVRIILCKRVYEVGIASNRKSASYGEHVPKFSTYRPSHHGNL